MLGEPLKPRGRSSRRPVTLTVAVLVAMQLVLLPAAVAATGLGDELYAAVTAGDEKKVRRLIEKGAPVDFRSQTGGWTCLHVAAQSGFTGIVAMLLAASADPSTQEDAGWTPLHLAVYARQAETATVLIEHGARVDLANSSGSTPLDLAVHMKLDAVSELIAARGGQSRSAGIELYNAASAGDLEEVQRLVDLGADVDITSPDGSTPLTVAAFTGQAKVVSFLLASGADKEGRACSGYSPLMSAAEQGHAEVVSILVGAGASISHTTNSGLSAIHLTAERGHLEIAKILLEHGADPNAGSTRPLFFAVEQNRPELVRLLVEHGAVVNPDKDWEPNSVMHIAARTGNLEMTKLLVALGAKPNVWNYKKQSPLDLAITSGNQELVQFLEGKGAHRGEDLDLVRVIPK